MRKRNQTTATQQQAAEMNRLCVMARKQVTWLPTVLQECLPRRTELL